MFLSHLGFKTYFLFIFWSKNGHFCRNQWKFGSNYHETFLLSLVSQLSVHCQSAGFHHYISRANASISKSFFSKRPPWGLNIIMKIDLPKLVLSVSREFTNVYCDQHLSPWFERCEWWRSLWMAPSCSKGHWAIVGPFGLRSHYTQA